MNWVQGHELSSGTWGMICIHGEKNIPVSSRLELTWRTWGSLIALVYVWCPLSWWQRSLPVRSAGRSGPRRSRPRRYRSDGRPDLSVACDSEAGSAAVTGNDTENVTSCLSVRNSIQWYTILLKKFKRKHPVSLIAILSKKLWNIIGYILWCSVQFTHKNSTGHTTSLRRWINVG